MNVRSLPWLVWLVLVLLAAWAKVRWPEEPAVEPGPPASGRPGEWELRPRTDESAVVIYPMRTESTPSPELFPDDAVVSICADLASRGSGIAGQPPSALWSCAASGLRVVQRGDGWLALELEAGRLAELAPYLVAEYRLLAIVGPPAAAKAP